MLHVFPQRNLRFRRVKLVTHLYIGRPFTVCTDPNEEGKMFSMLQPFVVPAL
jgi:hypothetical protein